MHKLINKHIHEALAGSEDGKAVLEILYKDGVEINVLASAV